MQIRGDGLVDNDEEPGPGSSATAQRVVYVLHPNCAIEEM
jgi:DNA replication licensing factor MCM6